MANHFSILLAVIVFAERSLSSTAIFRRAENLSTSEIGIAAAEFGNLF